MKTALESERVVTGHNGNGHESDDPVRRVRATFVCRVNPDATQVNLVGDFNGWNPVTTRMHKRSGYFQRTINVTPGEHQYKFVVDGEWVNDPVALGHVVNEFGSLNSVLWA